MAVDYTKVFTILGSYADKLINYYVYIGTFNTDQAAINTILAAQSAVYLGDGLTDLYDDFRQSVSDWEGGLISRMEEVLTDETLIGANFPFGSNPSVQEAFRFLITDMVAGDKNVTASVATIGSITYDCLNTLHGTLLLGDKLDGVTPPSRGAIAIEEYLDKTTQLTPDSETITITCVTDSNHGTQQGSERFSMRGVGAAGGPYSPTGEHLGNGPDLIAIDNASANLIVNPSFDSWTSDEADGWEGTTGVGGVDYLESTTVVYDEDSSSLQIVANAALEQTLNSDQLTRLKAYWLTFYARKFTDASTDSAVDVTIEDDNGVFATLSGTPTSTSWVLYSKQIFIPKEIDGDVILKVEIAAFSGTDPVIVDMINLVPCEYVMGVAMAIVGGPEKFIQGDTMTVTLSNDSAGKFQSVFRKAFSIQLPTDATPTISDSLVT